MAQLEDLKGVVATGWRSAAHLAEGTWQTSFVEHA